MQECEILITSLAVLSSVDLTFSQKIQEYHQSVKLFGSRSGLTFLFAKVISRR